MPTILLQLKITLFCFNIVIGDGKAEFSAVITPVFSINLSFRNNFYADWYSTNMF